MDLIFTKRSGKADELTVKRPGQPHETIACPKQGIIPHDLVHYAVESTVHHRGFLTLLREGATANFAAIGGESEEAMERLVETCQAEMWGSRIAAADLIATYEHACASREHGVVKITSDDVDAIRVKLDELTKRWTELPVNGAITVRF